MNEHDISCKRLARALPDLPRWVEVRSMLLSGRCELFGADESGGARFAVSDPDREVIALVGRPDRSVVEQALSSTEGKGVVICPHEDSDHAQNGLSDWRMSPAALHRLSETARLPEEQDSRVRLLAPKEIGSLDVPPDLKLELTIVAPYCLIAATFDSNQPVSFCYVAWETEGLWDVSIDTLAEYRGRGLAVPAVFFLIGLMKEKRKQPVWGAEESNLASMRLASKLGFVPVDRLAVFHSPW
jgi:RimJ/RimL family protein N-acetyltransferase